LKISMERGVAVEDASGAPAIPESAEFASSGSHHE
jgi:hypothetical protein